MQSRSIWEEGPKRHLCDHRILNTVSDTLASKWPLRYFFESIPEDEEVLQYCRAEAKEGQHDIIIEKV